MDDFFGVLIWVVIYAYVAYSLMIIANKTNTENAWLAWVPIANIYLMCKIAQKPGWWTILFFIPLVNIVISIIVWMKISELRGKPSWLGILWIIPPVGLILVGYLAFSD